MGQSRDSRRRRRSSAPRGHTSCSTKSRITSGSATTGRSSSIPTDVVLILCNIGRSRLPWIPSATRQRRWDVETPCPTTRIIVTVSFGGDALNDEIRSVGAAVSACKCGCDDRRAQSAPASDPRRSGTEGGTGPRRALYSPVSSRRSGLTRRGSRARSPNANSNHRREHTALRFRNQSLECIPQSIPRVPGKLRNLFLVATGKAA